MRILYILLFSVLAYKSFSQERGETNEKEVNLERLKQRTILDDTTKIIYGMETTNYISKESFLLSDTIFYTLDSTLNDIYDVSIPEKNNFIYQNLGNLGSPVNNLFYKPPKTFSLQSGISSLQPYIESISSSKFYNTKSPFIDLGIYFGGLGRSKVDFEFSRNINEYWNLTLAINRISSDKQIGTTRNKGDKNIKSSSIRFNIFHKSKNKKLSHYTDFLSFNHNILGTGGVDLIVDSLPLEFFLYKDFEVRLSDIDNNYKNLKLESYTSYKLAKRLVLYNQTKYENEHYTYDDLNLSLNVDFYENYLNNISTQDSFKLKNFINRVGIKGASKVINYDLYANLGHYKYHINGLENPLSDIYIGGLIKYKSPNLNIMSNFEIRKTSDYRFEVNLKSKILEASYLSALFEPKIFEKIFEGNHYSWNNNFSSSFVNKLNGKINLENKYITFSPSVNFYTINDYIYYVGDNHVQVDRVINFNQFMVDLKFNLLNKLIIFDNKLTYSISSKSAERILNFPKYHLHSKLYYNDIWFKNTIPVQLGTVISYRSKFYGDAYNPITQNFFVQNEYLLDSYLRFDIFFTMQVNNLRIFLKMNHFNQFNSYDGYFVTPYYPAQKKALDLGIKWYFFN
tara:strand:- start:3325 stop:5199 length:1875 start_codon:yes stop_codon:yes gene_type:complete